ncbi:putative nucleotidyltransferase [Methanohalophilus levihalophilus]|uniref:nucleotidyltransferase domain-containing protein n=1 Tax=Methanohalophilus levihalophilus TaxID=1431282 RepID=UPI001AE307FB|nr:nucleotidyltransferase domain-containing protein [Methanohalophilus levihalophilus]MBP2029272.1 putative nucleotidyltransferase [Methanohalophilus levihalophilus]
MKARLRDFLVTDENYIFAVVDYFHPREGIRSILRYVPDKNGDRIRSGARFRKCDFDVAFEFMRHAHPEWVEDVHIVPENRVREILHPPDRIAELAESDKRVFHIVDVLRKAGVPLSMMGVTGSMLPGLQDASSDIDFVVYGDEWFRAREAIEKAKADPSIPIEPIDDNMWQRIYAKRIPEISYEEFVVHELRKGNRGMVAGTYFDLLFVRDWDQIQHPLLRGKDGEAMEIEAVVTDATFAFDNPAFYKIEHDEIDHILSYTHTYSGQAIEGETIQARGIIEDLGDKKRLVIGTSREPKGEWMRSLTLLEENNLL